MFTNLAKSEFLNANNLKTSKDYEKWLNENGREIGLLHEMLYFSAIAYNMNFRIKNDRFSKRGLMEAFNLADEETQKAIMQVWEKSENYGATYKKKQQIKRR